MLQRTFYMQISASWDNPFKIDFFFHIPLGQNSRLLKISGSQWCEEIIEELDNGFLIWTYGMSSNFHADCVPWRQSFYKSVDLKCSHYTHMHRQHKNCEVVDMLTNLIVVITLQYIHVSNHHMVQLNLRQYYMSIIC